MNSFFFKLKFKLERLGIRLNGALTLYPTDLFPFSVTTKEAHTRVNNHNTNKHPTNKSNGQFIRGNRVEREESLSAAGQRIWR